MTRALGAAGVLEILPYVAWRDTVALRLLGCLGNVTTTWHIFKNHIYRDYSSRHCRPATYLACVVILPQCYRSDSIIYGAAP